MNVVRDVFNADYSLLCIDFLVIRLVNELAIVHSNLPEKYLPSPMGKVKVKPSNPTITPVEQTSFTPRVNSSLVAQTQGDAELAL